MTKKKNSHKIILDLCGGTGAWSKPYRSADYDVRLVTLPEHNVTNYIPPANVYGILAAPPCQEFSIAKGAQPRDFYKGMDIVKACLEIIWSVRCLGKLKFWALENPTGFLRQFLGKPPFSFKYWEFGDEIIKRTDLWGYFHAPTKTHTHPQPGLIPSIKYGWGKMSNKSFAELTLWREQTRPGFAQAFFAANK